MSDNATKFAAAFAKAAVAARVMNDAFRVNLTFENGCATLLVTPVDSVEDTHEFAAAVLALFAGTDFNGLLFSDIVKGAVEVSYDLTEGQ